MTKKEILHDPVVKGFLERISSLRSRIEKIILFGSRARGIAAPWSDYDLLIVVPRRDRDLVDSLYDAVVEVLTEQEREISLKIYTRKHFEHLQHLKTPFMKNVMREGIALG